ncbi:MAG: hypothetical protein BGO69_15880 [Bacteroidetes bacterium 46-16]|nr:MAG: hypothetical protein BGO69_15880 [Bacteroidetes bacterium 46-16]
MSPTNLGCKDNRGGLSKVWIGDYTNNLTYTITAGLIGTFSAGTSSFYLVEQPKNVSELQEKPTSSPENWGYFVDQTLVLTFPKLNAVNNNKIQTLMQGRFRAIVLDKNGTYHFMGAQDGIDATTGEGGTGKVGADLNGLTVTFTAQEPYLAYELSQTAAAQLIVP